MYKMRFCTSCNLNKKSVQVATCTNSFYKLQHVQMLNLYKLQLVQGSYLSVEQCILMNLYFKVHKVNCWPVYFQIFYNFYTVNGYLILF